MVSSSLSVYNNQCTLNSGTPIVLRDGVLGSAVQFITLALVSTILAGFELMILNKTFYWLIYFSALLHLLAAGGATFTLLLRISYIENNKDATYQKILDQLNNLSLASTVCFFFGLVFTFFWSLSTFF